VAKKRAGQVVVDFKAKTAQFEKSVSRIDKRMAGFGRSLKSTKRMLGGLATVLAGFASVNAFKNVVNDIDRIGKTAQRLGSTTEELSRLRHAGDLTGVSFNTLAMGLQRMTRRVSEAAQGTGEAKQAIKDLGLDARALGQLRPEDQFKAIADAMHKVGNKGDRVRLAMKLFDSEGVALIQTMEGGSAAINAMGADLDALGGTLTQDTVNSAVKAKDAFTRMGASMDAVQIAIATSIGPALAEFASNVANAIPQAMGFARNAFTLMRASFVEQIATMIESLADFIDMVNILPKSFGGGFVDGIAESMRGTAEALKDQGMAYREEVEKVERAHIAWMNSAVQAGAEIESQFTPKVKESAKAIEVYKHGIESTAMSLRELQESSMQALEAEGGTFGATWEHFNKDAEESADKMSEFMVGAARNMESAFSGFFFDVMKGNFKDLEQGFVDTINRMVSDLLASQLLDALTGSFGTTGKLGGIVGQAAAFGSSLFGFAQGGQFAVAGAGGTDSQVVAFRATPGERVTVTPPGQNAGGVTVNMNITTPDAGSFRRSQNQIVTQYQGALTHARRNQ
jgi:hypothetical protein